MVNKSNRYQELDALRGIASLMVVLFHFTLGRKEAQLGFKLGTTGVDLFFIISGFVIFMSLTKVKTSRDFIINRMSRLYPTYWTCISFTFILVSIVALNQNHGIPFRQYFANMTMFQYYFKIPDLDGPYWTLIIEMVFYVCILLLFHFKWLRYLNFFGVTLSISLIGLTSFFSKSMMLKRALIVVPLLQFLPLFFAGIVFYKIYTEKRKHFQNYSLIILCLICQIMLFKFAGRSKNYINHLEYSVMLTLYFCLFTLFVNGKLNFIVSKATLFLGKISYALYLVHQYVSLHIIIPYFVKTFKVNFYIASFCIALPIVIGLATLITYYIEVPLSKKLKEKLRTIPPFQERLQSAG